ncbi:MAG: type I-E CRISPR-associated protein Cse1/CasA [Gemmatimonadales bacterium]|nr:type I-E CRISPR-associated protein Cse1/CasA [Gemmatimonadales bacterium]
MNLLTDALFPVQRGEGEAHLPLPELLVALWRGDLQALLGVSSIQRQYLWRFLVRVAAHASEAERGCLEHADRLREILVEAAGAPGAWDLYRPDGGAAFLQPPAQMEEGAPVDFKPEATSRLTVVPGDKNHEFKRGALVSLSATDVLLSLLEYQFGSVYTKMNYASQIMGSSSGKGSGSPFMAPWWPDLGRTFRAHLAASLARADYTRDVLGLTGSVWALWTLPWDSGDPPLPAELLSPHFVPLARKVRLASPDASGAFSRIWFKPTTAARVADHTEGSGLGDPFTPFVADGTRQKVRGVMSNGFDYREVARLLLRVQVTGRAGAPSFAVEHAAQSSYEPTVPVLLEGMAFDQGKTLGFHRRVVQLPSEVAADPAPIAVFVASLLDAAKEAESALEAAIRTWLSGTPKPRSGDLARIQRLRGDLTSRVDRAFIELLPRMHGRQGDEWIERMLEDWRRRLVKECRGALERVMRATPTRVSISHERRVGANSVLSARLRRAGLLGDQPEVVPVFEEIAHV